MENTQAVAAHVLHSLLPDSVPSTAVVLAPAPMEILDNAMADHPPSVLRDPSLFPIASQPPVPPPNSSNTPGPIMHKNFLLEHAQRSRLPLPLYHTVNEASETAPKYRSTVLVNEVYYISPHTFKNRKAAEQDAARIALEYLFKKTKEDGVLLLNEDIMLCKSILSEYSDKMNLQRPTYTTISHKGSVSVFQSSLVFDGVVYTGDIRRSKKEAEQLAARAAILSLLGEAGNPKSHNALARIIASKVRLHAELQKIKDLHPSLVGNTEQHSGISIREARDSSVDHSSVIINKMEASATHRLSSTMPPFRPEYIPPKLQLPSPSVRLPIEFVPSENKKSANKKLLADNQLPTNHSQPPSLVLSAATGNLMN